MIFKNLLKSLLLSMGLLLLAGCGSSVTLTDELVLKYIQGYKNIRALSPEIAGDLKNQKSSATPDQIKKIDAAVKKAGFSGYPEFLKVNAAVALTFSQYQATRFMGEMGEMQDAGVKQIDEQLADPSVPEESKVELRKNREKLLESFEKNKGWADKVMRVLNFFTDEKSMAVVKRHASELEKAFTGL